MILSNYNLYVSFFSIAHLMLTTKKICIFLDRISIEMVFKAYWPWDKHRLVNPKNEAWIQVVYCVSVQSLKFN